MDINLILGLLDKSIGLISSFAADRPSPKKKELNKLHELKKNLIMQKNLPVGQQDFELIMNMFEELDAELDRVREVSGV